MDKENLKQLIAEMPQILELSKTEGSNINFKEYYEAILAELSINLNDTIDFLNSCNQDEFYWSCSFVIDLSKRFRSKELVDCVESNVARLDSKFAREALQFELDYKIGRASCRERV